MHPVISQSWLLTILSSVMCIFGSLIIFIDDLVHMIYPNSTFSIKNNESFLIDGFALSSGSLIVTSLYKLLPKALKFFQMVHDTKGDKHYKDNTYVTVFFMIGIFTCMFLNGLIHKFTSQSIVHCSHDGHSHTTTDTESSLGEQLENHNHTHTAVGIEHGDQSHNRSHSHNHEHAHSHSLSSSSNNASDEEEENKAYLGTQPSNFDTSHRHNKATEATPLLPTHQHSSAEVVSNTATAMLVQPSHISYSAAEEQDNTHHRDSQSYEDPSTLLFRQQVQGQQQKTGTKHLKEVDCITDSRLSHQMSYDLFNLEVYRDWELESSNLKSGSHLVAYTNGFSGEVTPYHPESFANPINHNHQLSPHNDMRASKLNHKSCSSTPLLLNLTPPIAHITIKPEPKDSQKHTRHKGDHQHKINTPISKLFSIGLQTCLALTLHKFPEGFITYITSEADPKLGLSIFLSLSIHNVIEGFTMTLPLYLSLNSKWKALGITMFFGGFSQPLGAVIANITLSGKVDSINKESSFFVFGALMALTCGFLTVVGLQLLISSVNFAGNNNSTANSSSSSGRGIIWWWICGGCVILVSGMLNEL